MKAPLYIQQAEQMTDSAKINIVSSVSKSFYNLLFTLEQINVLEEDTARLGRSVLDAYHQYVGGLVDVTDYEQAIITLNNSKAQLRQQTESIVPAYAVLKQTMGCPPGHQFNIAFDTVQMMQEIAFDTTQLLQYEKRIEYQQLQTLKKLLHQQTNYDKLSFLPSVSAIYNYYYEYENNSFPALLNSAYPYSYIGLTFNFPLFTGFSRTESVHKSRLQEQLADWDVIKLKSQIYTEYTSALAGYKSNLYNLQILRDNETKAKDVYRILSLQYKQGIVAYLNIIVAESNLITAETGYINALFQLLSSKIDLEKAVGIIPFNK
jgi:outer membrane protein TolC